MSPHVEAESQTTVLKNEYPMSEKKSYKYAVDGKKYETTDQRLTGAEIKQRAGVGPNFGLFLEGHGKGADRQVADNDVIDFAQPGHESFYTAPPATFGSARVHA